VSFITGRSVTLTAQVISLGNIFGVDENRAQELSDSLVLFDLKRGGKFSGRLEKKELSRLSWIVS